MYRIGFPGWKLAARFGVPLLIKIDVAHDREANVFIATSEDLRGLVVEAVDLGHLMPSVYECVEMLLQEQLKQPPKSKPIAAWNGDLCPT
jgi:Domain of unknown function (DUF1902)